MRKKNFIQNHQPIYDKIFRWIEFKFIKFCDILSPRMKVAILTRLNDELQKKEVRRMTDFLSQFTLLTNYSKSNFSLHCCVTFLLFFVAPSPFLCFWKLYRIFIILHLLFILFSSLIIIIISIAINSKLMKKNFFSIEKNHERDCWIDFWASHCFCAFLKIYLSDLNAWGLIQDQIGVHHMPAYRESSHSTSMGISRLARNFSSGNCNSLT